MAELDYYWVDFSGLRIEANSESEAYDILIKRFGDGIYPEMVINQEYRPSLRATPLDEQKPS